jgi:NAD(P)H-hydrate epimerase
MFMSFFPRQVIEWATVLAVGPGMAGAQWSKDMMDLVLASDKPMVVDAGGLNLLAEGGKAC